MSSAGFISLRCAVSPRSAVAGAETLEIGLSGGLRLSLSGSDTQQVADLVVLLDRRYADL